MEKKRIESIDAMRVVAILAVILIHTTTRTLEYSHYELNTYWWTLLLNQVSRFAVPLFFLISGFVLELNAGKDLGYIEFLKKRFTKIVIPYLFWTFVYFLFVYNKNSDNILKVILTGNASYQLYFIPTLCIFYLLFPVLHKLSKILLHPFSLVLLGAAQYFFLYQDYFIKHGGSDKPLRIMELSYFVFLLGMAAARNKNYILQFAKKWIWALSLAASGSGLYIFLEGRNLYYRIYNIGAIYSQYRPSVLIYTIIIAVVLYWLLQKTNLRKMSGLSYFVFFIHVILIEITWKYFVIFVSPNPVFGILFFLTIAGLSFTIAFLANKIPHLSQITG